MAEGSTDTPGSSWIDSESFRYESTFDTISLPVSEPSSENFLFEFFLTRLCLISCLHDMSF